MASRTLVIGGVSGSGKDTLLRGLMDCGVVRKGVTCTTRPQRPGEVDGVDYDFVTPAEFSRAQAAGELAEETVYIGNPVAYGITWRRVDEARESQLPTGWILDTVGLERIRELFPGEVLAVFLWGHPDVLRRRMHQRGESAETIARRLARFDEEVVLGIQHFDHAIETTYMPPEAVVQSVLSLMGGVSDKQAETRGRQTRDPAIDTQTAD